METMNNFSDIHLLPRPRSYPTYEEWKHVFGKDYAIGNLEVLILPMRNGNIKNGYIDERVIKSSYPTYEEWKLYKHAHQRWITCMVLILPMRNGNICEDETDDQNSVCSYPTYEEWKLYTISSKSIPDK